MNKGDTQNNQFAAIDDVGVKIAGEFISFFRFHTSTSDDSEFNINVYYTFLTYKDNGQTIVPLSFFFG